MQETLMKRWHEEFPRTYRQWRERYSYRVRYYSETINDLTLGSRSQIRETDRQIGRFRKRKAWGCGNARCCICHPNKNPRRFITYQEWCAKKKLTEGIAELNAEFNAELNGKT